MSKVTKTHGRWLALCAAAALMSGCVDETDETILLPVRVRDIPESVLSFELQQVLEEYIPIYHGDRPPTLEGSYTLSPVRLVHATDGYVGGFYDVGWSVSHQDWWNRCVFREQQGMAEGEGIEAWIVGTSRGFTLYTVEQMHDDQAGWDCTVVTLVSGRKVDRGIADCQLAVVMHDKRDANGLLVEPDTWRVFTDGDGMATQNLLVQSKNEPNL